MKTALSLASVLLTCGCGTFFGNPTYGTAKPKSDAGGSGSKVVDTPAQGPVAWEERPFELTFSLLAGPLATATRLTVVAVAVQEADGAWHTNPLPTAVDLRIASGGKTAKLSGMGRFPARAVSGLGLVLEDGDAFLADAAGGVSRPALLADRMDALGRKGLPFLKLGALQRQGVSWPHGGRFEVEVGLDAFGGFLERGSALHFEGGGTFSPAGYAASLTIEGADADLLPLCVSEKEGFPLASHKNVCAGTEARDAAGRLVFPHLAPGPFALTSQGRRVPTDLAPEGEGDLPAGTNTRLVIPNPPTLVPQEPEGPTAPTVPPGQIASTPASPAPTSPSPSPTPPPRAVTKVVAGRDFACALLSTSRVKCWGLSGSGVLGPNRPSGPSASQDPAQHQLLDLGGDVKDLAVGSSHACALLVSGGVRCWGSGLSGKLGYGNTRSLGSSEAPGSGGDVSLGGTAIAIAAGDSHSCAVLAGGSVRCWGLNQSGQLGLGTISNLGDNEVPSSVAPVSLGGPAARVATGAFHTCALMVNGAVRCWGKGQWGQLGLGSTQSIGDDEIPSAVAPVSLGAAGAVDVQAGADQSCALTSAGTLVCWGNSARGELGYGNTSSVGTTASNLPSAVGPVPVGGTVARFSMADEHVCAVRGSDEVICWGSGSAGQLGQGSISNIGDNETPASRAPVALSGRAAHVTAGFGMSCATLVSGEVQCWGLSVPGSSTTGAIATINGI